ncbi:MAG: 2-oxoacid:ferredoxin oxidoreductase subunit beta [Ignavibacteriales bacterium]|nr:MAG: 2-oxoacid:ferredoxin oxidoreductase subunit beta [Ignavibacteriaceae bacterium]MBW7872004.1 2-oxoacid:ferredoxin oxidoreductase subunit beta [Ignavibacteria bacterium]MCZ2144100.1 2-oxoacid:ferredoxin oxidoreductase subunit beta [Ignavibacteriales bacterium]OQY74455.1 MAG: 2-oxoacid:ferredoxin oxidoreductase subunit beta [Ignavibacteriales bacterium UTCHB3]MBV6446100.1 2-oxoglutarate oxidoreductase subunit KorB [Ignavibacteriaceae bacterium]
MTDVNKISTTQLTAKDFASDQEVKWCPGCGNYSILAQIQRVSPSLGVKKEDFVWVSGIGCSSRFPYYMDTYGIHGIHGRAPAIASGVKIARPELSVWMATGDGDLLSIGGNHFIHICRRNVGVKMILFNNKIYGLTKGQYSPTSEQGKKTKSTPYGSVDYPFNPAMISIGAGVTFYARTIDREPKHMQEMIAKASEHHGTALIEVYQNCNIFNDGAFASLTDKETKADNVLILEDGKPMVFGKDRDKGIKLDGTTPMVIDLNDGVHSINDVWVHKEYDPYGHNAFILAEFTDNEDLPVPIGIFRRFEKPTYEELLVGQIERIQEKKKVTSFEKLIGEGNVWTVE